MYAISKHNNLWNIVIPSPIVKAQAPTSNSNANGKQGGEWQGFWLEKKIISK